MLSLAMICRDNEDTIGDALRSAHQYVDDAVIVDTGSKDKTKQIVAQMGLNVVPFKWRYDFSAARNASLSLQNEPWVLWMDSDEYLPPESGQRIREAIENTTDDIGGITVLMKDTAIIERVAVFRNHPDIRFRGRIHEQIASSIIDAGYRIQRTDIVVEHRQKFNPDRLKRNIELLKLEIADHPENQYTLYKLGHTYLGQDQYRDAIHYFRKSKQYSKPTDNHLPKLTAMLIRALVFYGDIETAREAAVQGVRDYPNDPEIWFYWSWVAHTQGRFNDAAAGYEKAATLPQSTFEADASLVKNARHNQAIALADAKVK